MMDNQIFLVILHNWPTPWFIIVQNETLSMFSSGKLWISQSNSCKLWPAGSTGWFSLFLSIFDHFTSQGPSSTLGSCAWEEEDRLCWTPFPSQQGRCSTQEQVFTSAPKKFSGALAPKWGEGVWANQPNAYRGQAWAKDDWRRGIFGSTWAILWYWCLENIWGWR